MKIQILRNTILAGAKVKAGDVVDAPERDALILIGYKKAEIYTEPEAPVEATEPEAEADAEAEAEAAPDADAPEQEAEATEPEAEAATPKSKGKKK